MSLKAVAKPNVNSLLPDQSGHAGEFLSTDGTEVYWSAATAAVGIQDNGVAVGTQPNINFIEGSNVTLTITEDVGNNRVDVTINASGGGGGGLTVGTTAIAGGTNTRVLYDNAGILGEYTISGTGSVAMTTNPVFTMPDIGAALGDSLNVIGAVTVGNTGLIVGISTPFSDAAGVLTLQNVDALDATTEATIEAAIDTLANLTSIGGTTFTMSNLVRGEIVLDLSGGGSAIAAGTQVDLRIGYNCTITSWDIVADQTGSLVVDIWKDTYANFPPVVGDAITGSAKPTLSAATKAQSSTLTGWTTTLAAGDYLRFNVDSASTITRAVLTLVVTKT